ncbi:MAG: phenol hydroxylase [Bacteroidetes bacterium QS_4_64_154]|nr:MAG: phenol hydroxylase [Bacteroidetes bacterium QS_4_64_154]
MSPDPLDPMLVSVHSLTPRVKQFLLRVDGHTFDFTPGQHVSVAADAGDNPPEYRPYSPVSQPGTDTVALAVKRYPGGVCSTWMHEREVGDTISITSPSGNLGIRNWDRDVVFLATGTGLTPMVAMATQYLREGSGRATLVFGERTQEDLMFRETFDLYAANHSAFAVEYVLSDEDWSGPTGFVQDHLPDLIDDAAGTDFYVCGVPEMVVGTTAVLRDLGASEDHIFTEGWEEGAVEEENA